MWVDRGDGVAVNVDYIQMIGANGSGGQFWVALLFNNNWTNVVSRTYETIDDANEAAINLAKNLGRVVGG